MLMSAEDLIELALRREAELEQEAEALGRTRPYDWLAWQAQAQRKAAIYRQFVRVAEELKKLL